MKNRMSRCVVLMGTVMSLSGFAQVCQEISLYNNGEPGKMEQAGMTFPEAPEWSANWGEMTQGGTEALTPPYIRLSGMKDKAGDWTGALSLSGLPATVQGGNVSLKVRVSQKVKFGVWIAGDFGNSAVQFYNLDANRTYTLTAAVEKLVGKGKARVDKVGIGLFDVPAYQYTNLFVDDISFSCGVSENTGSGASNVEFIYPYSDISPESSVRSRKFMVSDVPETSAGYSSDERAKLADSTDAAFVLSEEEHMQVRGFMQSDSVTAPESRMGWFRSMFFVERNRLKDSVIANPKALFYEAEIFAAGMDNRAMPLLIGNVDYAYRICADTACGTRLFMKSRALLAGLPVATVNGSRLKMFYDPYFVSTNRKALPQVEVWSGNQWKVLAPRGEMILEFESAGIQEIKVRLTDGGLTVNQNIAVEVK